MSPGEVRRDRRDACALRQASRRRSLGQDPGVLRPAVLGRVHHQRALVARHARQPARQHARLAALAEEHERPQVDVPRREVARPRRRSGAWRASPSAARSTRSGSEITAARVASISGARRGGAISTPTPPWPARGLSTSSSKTSSASSSCVAAPGRTSAPSAAPAPRRGRSDHRLDVGVRELVVRDPRAVLVDDPEQPTTHGPISSRPMSESSRSAFVRR